MAAATLPPLESVSLPGDGVRLHAVTTGDPTGPPVVLLHGFPEFWYGWRHQIGPLAAAGFRVIALDQRGYNESDKPGRVADYSLDRLAADVVGCLDALGVRKAAVVGHDWGGIVAWRLAATRPDRVERLAVLNAPHPEAMRRTMTGDVGQLIRSWYVFAVQLPRLPEWSLARRDFAGLSRALERTSRPGTFTAADLDAYRRAWARPGALTGMLNWYRAALRYPPPPGPTRVTVPTLILWGERDRFIKTKVARRSLGYCDRGDLRPFPSATHWVQHEEPARVNDLLIGFLRESSSPPVRSRSSAPAPVLA